MFFATKSHLPWQPAWKSSPLHSIRPRIIIISCVAIFALVLITAALLHPAPLKHAFHDITDQAVSTYSSVIPSISEDARNMTLGFQKVFYISLPHRTDRQDAMTLLSDFAGIDSTWEEGINGDAVPAEGKVIGSQLSSGAFGCWRSHANIWRRMIKDNIATALIMEDDVDFDIDIKDQLYRISEGIQHGPNLVNDNPLKPIDSSAPYGTEWDLFFIGYCVHTTPDPSEAPLPQSIVVDDPSILDLPSLDSHHVDELRRFNVEANQTRLITRLGQYFCTQAYAVTQQGAKRLLYNIGYKDVQAPVDNSMSFATYYGDIRGIAPIPPLISQFKVNDEIDSNIEGANGVPSGEVNKENGHGWGNKNSARLAMNEWIKWKEKDTEAVATV